MQLIKMNNMRHYYYADKDQQFGPFSIDELISKRLKKSTLVWTDGMTDWSTADRIEELQNILVSEPPPLPKIKNNTPPKTETVLIKYTPTSNPTISSKSEISYEKESEATISGVLLAIGTLFLNLRAQHGAFSNNEWFLIIIAYIIIRIIVTVWVVNIASRQNRNTIGWGIFAFGAPSWALIFIGLLNKIKLKIELNSNLPVNQQVYILFKKAKKIFLNNRYSECVEILNKAIEIDNHNFDCIELSGLTNYKLKNYEKSKQDFETLFKNEKHLSTACYHLGNFAIMDKNIELAVSYWLKAYELKNENAKKKLDLFHTYTRNYLLNNMQVISKINGSICGGYIYRIIEVKYQGGLHQIDKIEKIRLFSIKFYGYDNGIHVEFKEQTDVALGYNFKTYHLGIAYYEIDNIVFMKTDKKLELHLSDKNILTFVCDHTKADNYDGIRKLCNYFMKSTDKTPDASQQTDINAERTTGGLAQAGV